MVSHEHFNSFVDASSFVWHSVDVVDWDWFRKLTCRKLGCGNEVSVNKVAGRTCVHHGLSRCLFYGVCGFQMDGQHNAVGALLEGADN